MANSISATSSVLTPEQVQQRLVLQQLGSYDKDKQSGISKTELNSYVMDSNFGSSETPEFAKQLQAKFDELDKDKNGQLSGTEMSALTNVQGIWQVGASSGTTSVENGLAIKFNPGTMPISQAQSNSTQKSSTSLLSENIKKLTQEGINYVKKNPELINKVTDAVKKLV